MSIGIIIVTDPAAAMHLLSFVVNKRGGGRGGGRLGAVRPCQRLLVAHCSQQQLLRFERKIKLSRKTQQ